MKKAYLIVICNEVTNAIESATVWSSPEWEQLACLKGVRTYVAFSVTSSVSYEDAATRLVNAIREPDSRYSYLYPYLMHDIQAFGTPWLPMPGYEQS